MKFHSKNGSRRRRSRASASNRHSFQSLEDRRMLATFTVTSLGDGISFGVNDEMTLREAIFAANDNSGADSIVFQSGLTGRIALINGELVISGDLTITGPGAASDLVIDAQRNSRVIRATGGLTLDSLTVENGRASGDFQNGGGILLDGFSGSTLTLNNSTVSGNETSGNGADGGGVWARFGDVTLNNSTVSGNATSFVADGGGIGMGSGALTLNNSTVSGNTSGGGSGGIYSRNGDVTLTNSTVSGNTSDGLGGGIGMGSGALTLTNSTVSGNTSGGDGGGIRAAFGDVTLTNSTVAGNTSGGSGGGILSWRSDVTLTNSTVSGNTASGAGGGIAFPFNNFTRSLTVYNSIIAGNSDNGRAPDFEAPRILTVKHSIIGDTTGTTLTAGNDNQLNVDFTTVVETEVVSGVTVPLLTNNGGSVETIALLANSPAIDAGDNVLAVDADGNPLLTDQRSTGFGRLIDGDGDGGATVDIGAVEFAQAFLLGDADLNGEVNFLDIAPFISILANSDFLNQADIDRNGVVNFLDISPFINILSGGGRSSQFSVSSPAPLASESVDTQSTTSSVSSMKVSDRVSVERVATPSSLSSPASAVAVADFSVPTSEPSQLGFFDAREFVGLGDSANFQSDNPIQGYHSTMLSSTQEQAISRADQERANDFYDKVVLQREGDLEFTTWKSSGDLFDGDPDLLDGLADAKLDEVFEELLI